MKFSKRCLSLLLALALTLGLAACTSAPQEPSSVPSPSPSASAPLSSGDQPSSGVYTASAPGRNGNVTVQVTLADGSITAIEITESSETAGMGDVAMSQLSQAILDGQTLALDAVSGATMSSTALLAAVEDCLTQAGLDLSVWKQTGSAEKDTQTLRTQVLVIGAGAAGLSAGCAALEGSKEVLVIEKNGNVTSCATALSGGGFVGGASRLQKELGVEGDTPQQIYADLLAGGKDNIPSMLSLLAENCGTMVDWLWYDLQLPVKQSVSSSIEHTYARGFSMEGGAPQITSSLSDKLLELGGELKLSTRATELIVENDAVVGVKATAPDAEYEIYADAVILATGGYGANPDLLPSSMPKALYYGPATSTGDGLLMAQKLGADTVYLDHVKIYPQGIEIAPGLGAVSTGGSMNVTKQDGAIYVNKQGQRVVNENAAFTDIRDVTLLEDDQTIYLLMEASGFEIWKTATVNYHFMSESQIDQAVAQNGGTPLFAHGDTLEEVAAIAGIDPAALSATVDRWNEMVDAGEDADFGNPTLSKIEEGPYYILEQKLRFASTLGGVVVDPDTMQVTKGSKPIKGLYACGEIIGGAHGQDSMPTCNVGWALTTGMLAGRSVSKKEAQ